MTTITGKTNAWLGTYGGPETLNGEPDKVVGRLMFSDRGIAGWTKVGVATVTVELPDKDTLILNKVEALNHEIAKTQADAEVAVRRLRDQVQQLLAITNEVIA